MKNINHFVFLNFYFGTKSGSPALGMANSLVVHRVSPGRIIVVFFWTKYAVPHQIKPRIHKLTTSRGQRNLCTVFIFVSHEEKSFYRIVSLGHQNFDCQLYCGLSRRMQGSPTYSKEKKIHELICSWLSWLVLLLVGTYAQQLWLWW